MLAAIVAAFIVPVGFALSPETASAPTSSHPPLLVADVRPVALSAPVLAPQSSLIASLPFSEGGKLLLVGAFLFGLAAVVRRSV
jgi:hypothetical protein